MIPRQTKAPYRREHTGDPKIDQVQRASQDMVQRFGAIPFLIGGRLISVKLGTGVATIVNHGLGARAAAMVIRINYDGSGNAPSITESATSFQSGLDLANQLSIVSSAACTVDLWFYPVSSKLIPVGSSQSP